MRFARRLSESGFTLGRRAPAGIGRPAQIEKGRCLSWPRAGKSVAARARGVQYGTVMSLAAAPTALDPSRELLERGEQLSMLGDCIDAVQRGRCGQDRAPATRLRQPPGRRAPPLGGL